MGSMAALLTLTIDGEALQVEPGRTLAQVLSDRPVPAGFVVLVNGRRIPRADHSTTPLQNHDEIQVIQPIAGG